MRQFLLYNHKLDSIDIAAPQYHQRQASRQEWNVGSWLRSKGISLADLDGHQQITDVITLINIRDELWLRMNRNEQATWGAYWSLVYGSGYPLNKKFWKKFDVIVKHIDTREQRLNTFRDHLKAQHRTIQNLDYDNNG